jgi:DNA-binding beta-propeller fold protein YncE
MRVVVRTFFLLVALFCALPALAQTSFLAFESGPVRPLALTPDGTKLLACNPPDNRLEVFVVSAGGLTHAASIPVGMEPVAVAARNNDEAWVVNHLSDSISVVDLSATPPHVKRTLLVGDEPRDIVFAGSGGNRAFVTTARRGQQRTSLPGVPGAGNPFLTQSGIPRADVWVWDADNFGTHLGGTPVRLLSFFADTPRALATDGTTVYVAAFHSGNQTAAVNESAVCNGFTTAGPCSTPGGATAPGGLPGPSTNAAGAPAPETGLIVKFDPPSGEWRDPIGRDWGAVVPFELPDFDVFAVNADTLGVVAPAPYARVGTILFNMAINPATGKLYVSNTESPNLTRFEGPGVFGGSTVQGHISEARISVIDPATGSVDPQHLNPHIDYSELFTGPNPPPSTQKFHSLATPLQMVISSTGKVYVAAYGSAKIGVIDATALENPNFEASFDPTTESANYIPTGGGPSGLVLDEARGRLYVFTRFDDSVSVIDLATRATLATHPLHNPERSSLLQGRPFLYDAVLTSGNGEASCSSCHIFGDTDSLGWDLGNPDDVVVTNPQPHTGNGAIPTLHPMKGPMLTQTLRGMATHGALHARGDRANGFFGVDPCPPNPAGSQCDEDLSFRNFIVAFPGLVGRDGMISASDMQKYANFALQLQLPPNPVRNLDNSMNTGQTQGFTVFKTALADATNSGSVRLCTQCHTIDAAKGFFGSNSTRSKNFEGPQNFKTPGLRHMYTKIGMFGSTIGGAAVGNQVRGWGFNHDGSIDSMKIFLDAPPQPGFFNLTNQNKLDMEQFMLAFPSDLAPIVGQQITLDASNSDLVSPRINLLLARAGTAFTSLILGGTVTECDLIVKGSVGGTPRGWVRQASGLFQDDTGATMDDASLRALATSEGPLTYTCAPPGSGMRMGVDRDEDTVRDGVDNCPMHANPDQLNTDGDAFGNVCDADDDGDGLPDVVETNTGIYVGPNDTGTNPLLADTDSDTIADGLDNCPLVANTSQQNTDADGFGNACDADDDGDGLDDSVETDTGVFVSASDTGTSPLLFDTDGDSLSDAIERATGLWVSASDPGTSPVNDDTDGDGWNDATETNTGIYVSISNTGSHPLLIDTDGDGANDGLDNCLFAPNPNQLNTDGDDFGNACDDDDDNDGLLDVVETNTGTYNGPGDTGTNPLLVDTDGDGFGDSVEVEAGSDPTNAASIPGGAGMPALSVGGLAILAAAIAAAARRERRRVRLPS